MSRTRKYTVQHFASEESCAHAHFLQRLPRHRRAYARFVDRFQAFRREVESGKIQPDLAALLHEHLYSWLAEHISRADKKTGTVLEREKNITVDG